MTIACQNIFRCDFSWNLASHSSKQVAWPECRAEAEQPGSNTWETWVLLLLGFHNWCPSDILRGFFFVCLFTSCPGATTSRQMGQVIFSSSSNSPYSFTTLFCRPWGGELPKRTLQSEKRKPWSPLQSSPAPLGRSGDRCQRVGQARVARSSRWRSSCFAVLYQVKSSKVSSPGVLIEAEPGHNADDHHEVENHGKDEGHHDQEKVKDREGILELAQGLTAPWLVEETPLHEGPLGVHLLLPLHDLNLTGVHLSHNYLDRGDT